MTIAIVASHADPASLNIRDSLLAQGGWGSAGFAFESRSAQRRGSALLVEIDGWHIRAEGIDARVREAAGESIEAIIFASRHRAESGSPALTVHPIGNLADTAEVGGSPGRLSPSAPALATRTLAGLHGRLRELRPRRRHRATFEATHHGPLVETPAAFVEIGTSEDDGRDPALGALVARAIAEAIEGGPALVVAGTPTVVALGGSHYAPRASDLALSGKALVGHIVPGYQLDAGISPERVALAARLTPGATHYFLDARGFKADVAPYVAALEAEGLRALE